MDQLKSAAEGTLAISVSRDFALSGYLIKPEPHQSFKSVGKIKLKISWCYISTAEPCQLSHMQSNCHFKVCWSVIFKDLEAFFNNSVFYIFKKKISF